MKTAEEKANEFLDKNIVDLFGSPPDAAYNGFIAGYKEAKKWNKIEDGLPEKGVKCIVKMENGDHHISERVDLWSGQKHPVPQGVKQKQYWLGMFHMQDEIKYWREI